MDRKLTSRILRAIPMIAGIALFSSSVSGLLQANEAAEKYRARVDPVVEQYVLGKRSDHSYATEAAKPMMIDDRIELIADLHGLNFDLNRQGSFSALRYRLFGGVALLVAGGWLIGKKGAPKERKPEAEQGVRLDAE